MNSAVNRRAVLRGAVLLAAGTVAAPGIAAADEFKELTWYQSKPSSPYPTLRTRVISGIPAVIGYGQPVAAGPVIVQVIGSDRLGVPLRAVGYNAISAVMNASIVVTDARGLSGRFPVTLQIPRTEVPRTVVELVLTGTATLTGGGSPPLPRNPGPMTIAVEPRSTGVVTLYYTATGAPREMDCQVDLQPASQNPLIATIEVR